MTDTSDTQPLPAIHSDNVADNVADHVSVNASRSHQLAAPASPELVAGQRRSRQRNRRTVLKWVVSLASAFMVIVLAGLVGITTLIYLQARTDEGQPVDAIVVMGAAQFNGRPSPVLQARLDQALALYESDLAPRIVVTGGKQPGDAFTEAETGYRYLTERGVPEEAIVLENDGRSTWESMQGLPAVLPLSVASDVLIVSDGFHLFRSELMLRELGYDTHSSPATESPIRPWSATEFGYVVREVGGVVVFLPELLW